MVGDGGHLEDVENALRVDLEMRRTRVSKILDGEGGRLEDVENT